MRIRFGFSKNGGAISRIIRFFNRAQVSHAFVEIEGTELGDLVLEAWWDGVRLTTKAVESKQTIVAYRDPAPELAEACARATMDAVKTRLDERYDYEGLFGMAWVAMARWAGKKVKNPIRSSKAMFCSELMAEIVQKAGWPGSEELDPQSESPEDMAEFLGVKLTS